MMTNNLELSIVIPVLNEEIELPETLQSLAGQRGVDFEIIIVDGGSTDSSCERLSDAILPVSVINGPMGRASQLNRGAAAAKGGFILFLHADSRFADPEALRHGIDQFKAHDGGGAGHFRISFRGYCSSDASSYAWLEKKARSDRAGTSHGDQGVLVPARLFRESGGFDESCQVLAETRFADRLRGDGRWVLLAAEISSSARRFVREGFRERMLLNMVIMALAHGGADHILEKMPEVYRSQGGDGKLKLSPIFRLVRERLAELNVPERGTFWDSVGRYACDNVWQAALWLDWNYCGDRGRLLELYDSRICRVFQNRGATRLAAVASRLWLRIMAR